MPAPKPGMRERCLLLRQVDRLSIKEIHRITGASIGSLSHWLRDFPLSREEMRAKASVPPISVKKDRPLESGLHLVVKDHGLSTSQIAKVSETAVMLRLLTRGVSVFGSIFDGDRADWVVEAPHGSRLWKLQVKTTNRNNKTGLPTVSLKRGSNSTRYIKGDFDFIVGFDIFEDRAYVWSWDETKHLKSAVTVAEDAAERWDKLNDLRDVG